MTREELKNRINAQDIETEAERWGLKRDRSGKGWMCQSCDSGRGQHGTGMRADRERNRLHCFACGANMDVLDIIQETQRTDYNGALQIGAEAYGLAPGNVIQFTGARTPQAAQRTEHKKPEVAPDDTAFRPFEGIRKDRGDSILPIEGARAYLEARGIPGEYADKYGILHANHWSVTDNKRVPSVIFPTGGDTYQCKALRPDNGPGASHAEFTNGGSFPFNANALRNNDVVAVTEGAEDALACIAVGLPAVSLQGCEHKRLMQTLAHMLENGESIPTLILALDNDDAGRKATRKLAAALDDREVRYTRPNLYGGHKDANDLLRADRDAFAGAVRIAMDEARKTPAPAEHAVPIDADAAKREAEESERRAALRELAQSSMVTNYRTTFQTHIDSGYGTPISTGFTNIDTIFGGGFRPGLYVLGAGTGIGKTSLSLQIADNVARSQHPVLYVSMEMSRDELIGKSITRIARGLAEETGGAHYPGLNAVLEGKGGPFATVGTEVYFEHVAPWMHQIEGIGDQTAEDVRAMAEAVAEMRGTAPFVIVDYVQILASPDVHLSDKQAVDRNTYALKRLSRDLNTPVLAISTMNRASYGFGARTPNADMLGALKESGALEYTGDAAIILYRIGKDPDGGERMEARTVKGRRIPPRADWMQFVAYGGSSYFEDAGTTPYRDIKPKKKYGTGWERDSDDYEEYTGPMPNFGDPSRYERI